MLESWHSLGIHIVHKLRSVCCRPCTSTSFAEVMENAAQRCPFLQIGSCSCCYESACCSISYVRALPTFCPHLLSASCPLLVRILSASCPLVVHFLSVSFPLVVRILSTSCPHLVRILSASCPLVVRILSTSCPHLVLLHASYGCILRDVGEMSHMASPLFFCCRCPLPPCGLHTARVQPPK